MSLKRFGINTYRLVKYVSTVSNINTIFALSSGQGKCGVAVIRVSGPHAGLALKRLTKLSELPKPRQALLKKIYHPESREMLDQGLVLWFPGPRSFTGEDSCEFQVHGGVAVVTAILKALGCVDNLRLAEPGEFTKRAFYNGKLDLTEVEGIADLLAAETEIQRQQAVIQSQGYLSKLYGDWKSHLMHCLANLEAYIDFEETETLDVDAVSQAVASISKLKENLEKHVHDGRKGERLRNGVKTVIIGEPNVGKSSLLNALCQRPAAIVTPIEGTTRDVIEVLLDVSGYPIILKDTAGLRSQTDDVVEKEGINRTLDTYRDADLVLLVIDCKKYSEWLKDNPSERLVHYLEVYVKQLNVPELLIVKIGNFAFSKPCIVIANKIDLVKETYKFEDAVAVSCMSQNGFLHLLKSMSEKLKDLCGQPTSEHPSMTQARHRRHLEQCLVHLNSFLNLANRNEDIVLMTEQVRKSLYQLGKITGSVTVEQILDIIFKQFCIGK